MTEEWRTIRAERAMTREQASGLVGEMVPEPDRASVIYGPTVVLDAADGQPVLAYLPLPQADTDRLTRTVLQLTGWTALARANDLRCLSRTFGMAPRRPAMKHDSCRITQLARDNPAEHAVLTGLSLRLAEMLAGFAPDQAATDRATITAVADEWRMAEGSLWTSGVVNHTAQLPYHRDGMNFDAWSAMPVIRRGVSGGYLHVPEYGLTPACQNGYVVFFNGYRLVHGVTPFTNVSDPRARRRPTGQYRFSVVYYALSGMKDCFTHAAEVQHGHRARTGREQNQAEVVAGLKTWR